MKGEEPTCSGCGYPVHINEHAPDCPKHKESKESSRASLSQTASIEAIGGDIVEQVQMNVEEYKEALEQAMLEAVQNLPDELANELGTIDASALEQRAKEIQKALRQEGEEKKRAELQIELIYQFITLISRVQGPGDKAITPALARELKEMDCSLSAWSLKEKIANSGVKDLDFEFGYPANHAVGMVKLADGRQLYVDAQNGFAVEVTLSEVVDSDKPDTAYPIYEMNVVQKLSAEVPGEGVIEMGRTDGSDHVPQYLGVRTDGALHTLGNMHMLVNPDSSIYNTNVALTFRERLNNDEDNWQAFQDQVHEVAGGSVIQETKFYQEAS